MLMDVKKILTLLLFPVLLGIGFWFALHNPLWNDEFNSLISSTLRISYLDIWLGKIGEGNNSPLFYFLQKIQCDIFSYHPPQAWLDGQWMGRYLFSQFFLRIQPVIFSAVAICAIFYFFASRYSLGAAFFSLFVSLSSLGLWNHWAEARPYSLWFLLSTLQMLILTDMLKSKAPYEKHLSKLICIHVLLSLTSIISIVQIMACYAVLWLFVERRLRYFWGILLAPAVVCIYYYILGPKFLFYFVDGPLGLINANLPKDRMIVFIIFALYCMFKYFKNKQWKEVPEIRFLFFSSIIMFLYGLVLFKLKLTESQNNQGFQISGRYFGPLTPLGIIGVTMFAAGFYKIFNHRFWRISIVLVFCWLCFLRIERTVAYGPKVKLLTVPEGLPG